MLTTEYSNRHKKNNKATNITLLHYVECKKKNKDDGSDNIESNFYRKLRYYV